MRFLLFILDRLHERSTWMGLTGFAAALGVALNPEQVEALVAAGVALASTIAVFTRDTEK